MTGASWVMYERAIDVYFGGRRKRMMVEQWHFLGQYVRRVDSGRLLDVEHTLFDRGGLAIEVIRWIGKDGIYFGQPVGRAVSDEEILELCASDLDFACPPRLRSVLDERLADLELTPEDCRAEGPPSWAAFYAREAGHPRNRCRIDPEDWEWIAGTCGPAEWGSWILWGGDGAPESCIRVDHETDGRFEPTFRIVDRAEVAAILLENELDTPPMLIDDVRAVRAAQSLTPADARCRLSSSGGDPTSVRPTTPPGGVTASGNVPRSPTSAKVSEGDCLQAERDAWIYERAHEGQTNDWIAEQLFTIAPERRWEPLTAHSSLRDAIARHCRKTGAPYVERRGGRPRKETRRTPVGTRAEQRPG